jgi:hypothetical protein
VGEAQPLGDVVQLDVHAQVVAVHLQLVARDDPAVLGDVEPDVGDLALHVERPVPVGGGVGVERDGRRGLLGSAVVIGSSVVDARHATTVRRNWLPV